MVVDPQLRRLPVGQQSYSRQAGLAHKRDHGERHRWTAEPPHSPPSSNGAESNVIGAERFCAWRPFTKSGSHTLYHSALQKKETLVHVPRRVGSLEAVLCIRDAGPPLVEAEVAPDF